MNKKVLLPKMAVTGIRKNAGMYLPYILTTSFSAAVYLIFSCIIQNKMLESAPYAMYLMMLLQIGKVLLGLILLPFLFYTNSFLVKKRKKEFGLYHILGLGKKQTGVMMFVETGIIYAASMVIGSLTALVFGKLLFLTLLRVSGLPVTTTFTMDVKSFLSTFILFGIISLLNLITNLWQIGRANPSELLGDPKKGEKEPKHLIIFSLAGIILLGGGYYTALTAQMNSYIFTNFFLAVFLVIAGTYFLFTAGSISFLKLLKRNKKFYYKKENYVTVSGMLYRMKKSAASLSNICIFSTMVIITLLCTVSLFLGEKGAIKFEFPLDAVYSFDETQNVDMDVVEQNMEEQARQNHSKIKDKVLFRYLSCTNVVSGNILKENDTDRNWGNDIIVTRVIPLEDFNRMEGTDYTLEGNEILMFSTTMDFGYDTAVINGTEYPISQELTKTCFESKEPHSYSNRTFYIVMKDWDTIKELGSTMKKEENRSFRDSLRFNLSGDEKDGQVFYQAFDEYCKTVAGFDESSNSIDWKYQTKSMYGGLLFIGIFFGLIFMICLVLIMYYKQISEGMEDKGNFEIMQEVGMDDKDVKSTIHRQIMLVFYMPLVLAVIHTFIGLGLTIKLLYALNLFNTQVILFSALGIILFFAIFYGTSYGITAKAYYKIVKRKE